MNEYLIEREREREIKIERDIYIYIDVFAIFINKFELLYIMYVRIMLMVTVIRGYLRTEGPCDIIG